MITEHELRESQVYLALYTGVFWGILLIMMSYNGFLFLSTRDKNYIFYVLFLLFFLLANLSYNGYLYLFVFQNNAFLANWAHSFLIYSYQVFAIIFAMSFLNSKKVMPKSHLVMKIFLIILLTSMLITHIFGFETAAIATSVYWSVAFAALILVVASIGLLQKNRAVRSFAAGSISSFIGSASTSFSALGLVPFTFVGFHGIEIGVMLDSALLSFALADKINALQRQRQEELQKLVDEKTADLKKATETKDRFFMLTAHDLRGPIGSLSLLFNEIVRHPQDFTEELHTLVQNNVKSTSDFLEQLILWARNQRGEIEYKPEVFKIADIADDVVELYSTQIKTKRLHVIKTGNVDSYVKADILMTSAVFRNMFSNALKYSPVEEAIEIHITREREDQVTVMIIDHGEGVGDPEALFGEKTKKQSAKGTMGETGTGIGLELCQTFMHRQKGEIGYRKNFITTEGTTKNGSIFYFTLPESNLVYDSAVQRLKPVELIENLKALIVEDNDLHLRANRALLESIGLTVDSAASGKQGLLLINETQYDFVFLDFNLPDINGIEVAKQVKASGKNNVIFSISALGEQEIKRMDVEDVFDDYLGKPLFKSLLMNKMKRYLKQ